MSAFPKDFVDNLAKHFASTRPVSEIAQAASVLAPASDDILALETFAHTYLKADAGPRGLVPLVPESQLHLDLVTRLDSLDTIRGIRDNWRAPRGNAKSTWLSLAYPIRQACYRLEQYIILTADTNDQAQKYLGSIRTEFEDNDQLRDAFPGVRPGTTWREDKLLLTNGVLIESLGTGMKLRGRRHGPHRPSLIVVDDPQNLDHVISDTMRRRSLEWLMKDVCNAGSPSTNIIVAGTALHQSCIVCVLEKTPGWNTHRYRSIIQWPERMDLWKQWEEIYRRNDDPEREAKALAFYEANKGEMDQ